MKNHNRKIGSNRGRPRIWLEGAILAAAGWQRGTRFNAKFLKGSLVYERAENGSRAVAGTKDRPIIDTNTEKIRETLGAGEKVRVKVKSRRIIIKMVLVVAAIFLPTFGPHARKVLVACEYSGTVRDAFAAKGHHAVSCDFLPTETPGLHHQGDVLPLLAESWDDIFGFPPCTFVCSSGLWRCNPKHDPDGTRAAKRDQAVEFFKTLLNAPVDRICLENPVGCLSTVVRKPDQIIQPFHHGHPESKKTCLWLKNLPLLTATDTLDITQHGKEVSPGKWVWQNQTPSGQNNLPPTKDRGKIRSKTYTKIGLAMADQWG